MEVTLERFSGGAWKAVDPGLVLSNKDKVRFRFRANFDGYLYVTNKGTAGTNVMLFPSEETGSMNKIEAGHDYTVPATSGAFRVEGPAGHDVVSWMVSPLELARPNMKRVETPGEAAASAPIDMKPRCNDTIFKARGECVDSTAGPQAPKEDGKSRELMVMREKKASVISSQVPLDGPVVYEFRLAHR
jgi:hypothetical protein